ncbi:glycine betaine ABC transporter substrate-binding protein [Glycomyces salinus]|uniref:glycine betaine ABC transporter substrate-binding protein n=1 Tax=Glycomyces salinus TaxID=980294 RepID=UPI0018EC4B0B|nr:glycine betaine ABC transporter substrate-binding protein [Glycomyces salinus]
MANLNPRTALICVDFGTSHTVVTLHRPDGRIHQQLFDGSPQLPSAVFVNDEGGPVVGADAVHSGRRSPERFEPNPKRRIDEGTVLLGKLELPVTGLIAAVFSRVARECERTLGGLGPVTVTVPAAWGPTRRHVVADAATAAGLGDVTLVPEPVAAAGYFVEVLGSDVPTGSGVVVYDLGGGTFDATVLRRTPAGFEVLAVDGADDLGGLDFDQALAERLAASVRPDDERWQRLTSPQSPADLRHRRAFLEEVRSAKERLSRAASTDLTIPLLDVDVHLTREELETVAAPLLERTVRLTQGALRESGLAGDQIAGLFLVGAASRMPLAATMLHRGLGIAPEAIEQPELAVSEGGLAAGSMTSSPPTATPGPALPPQTAPAPAATAPLPPPPQRSGASGWLRSKRGMATVGAGTLALLLVIAVLVSIPLLRDGGDSGDDTGTLEAGQDSDGDEATSETADEPSDIADERSEFGLPEGDGDITIGSLGWDEVVVAAELWRHALEGSGYTVETREFSNVEQLYEALDSGDIDLTLSGWDWSAEGFDVDSDDRSFEQLGIWLDFQLTVAVPAYVDDLDSLEELNGHADLFGGRIVGIEEAAALTETMREAVIPTYDIEELILETSSTPAMLAELDSAIAAEEPIAVTLWQPHWAYDEYDLKNLEDPDLALGEPLPGHSLVHIGFNADHPDLADALDSFSMSHDELASLMNTVLNEYGGDAEAGVTAWLEDNTFSELIA